MKALGVVAIGRNEGERLKRCIDSVLMAAEAIVYVDSGSTDGSVACARGMDVEVVELDTSIPFTAARARNAGLARLLERFPDTEYVQFVDGDCEFADGWFDAAVTVLEEREDAAIVCGRRRERHPEATVYNRLCDMEWNTPVGEAKACGGDALCRVDAIQQVDAFNPMLIAGEEPEMCFRLRHRGWKILRIEAEMTLHDAAMAEFGQWWRRSVRAGHAYAENAWMHGGSPERWRVKEVRSIVLWGAVMPALALVLAWPMRGLSVLVLAALYAFQGWRVYRYMKRRSFASADASLYSFFTLLGKFPMVQGVVQFHWARLTGKRRALIEYK